MNRLRQLWELVEPLLPKVERRRRHTGHKRLDDRRGLCEAPRVR
ncbi:hypothetical protein SAMN06265355_104304 [Actinomadura mexicana]|uniref:Transposase of IS4/5 family n=1 Tax=Actinomadura mexicana TaxID=134959 RepID=A0A238XGK0_9ACTN|nr:hypothetical protein SAMN06265355_104304 [Actinomadura mexicana]